MFLHYGLLSTTILQMELDFQSHVKLLRNKYHDQRDQIMQQIGDHSFKIVKLIDQCSNEQDTSSSTIARMQHKLKQLGSGKGDGMPDTVCMCL